MKVVLSLGSNQGDRIANLSFAIEQLRQNVGEVFGVSSVYETEPVGEVAQDDFLNMVAVVETPLTAQQVLAETQQIELAAGRVRELRWGPRTLDIDIVDIENQQVDSENLTVPHPLASKRAFVLIPLQEVLPDWILGGSEPVAVLLSALANQKVLRFEALDFDLSQHET